MAAVSIVLHEKVLESITCSFCKKCLSFGETKIYPFGKISCGRCWPADEHLGCVSLYGRVAPYLLFPCTNQRYGCEELLPYNRVEDHEEICTKVPSYCPLCPRTLKFSLTELIKHFEIVHPQSVMDTTKYSLNINSFEKTEMHLLFNKPFYMLMFVKFDGQWLYINVSVPYEYIVAKYKQKVKNLRPKLCSFLGKNDDCFKFFLPRSLDCIAKIQVKFKDFYDTCKYYYSLTPFSKLQMDRNVIKISISFIPREIDNSNAVNVKTELEPLYVPQLYVGENIKKCFEAKYGDVDVKSLTYSPCTRKIINLKNPDISIQVRCDWCEHFFWDVSQAHLCQYKQFIVCGSCWKAYLCYGNYKKNGDDFKEYYLLTDLMELRFYCRFNCGGIVKMDQIVDHEETCEFNLFRSMTDFQFGKLCFGSVFNKRSKLVWADKINHFDFEEFPTATNDSDWIKKISLFNIDNNKAFLVTKDGRKCIFLCKSENDRKRFLVEHEYDKTKFFTMIRILCPDGTVKEEENSFFLTMDNPGKYCNFTTLHYFILFKAYEKI